MLSDLRNCFRGRTAELEFFLTCPRGEATRLAEGWPWKTGFRGGGIEGLWRKTDDLSAAGELSKASARLDTEEAAGLCHEAPFPDLKGGGGMFSIGCLAKRDPVERPFARDKDGRRRPGFFFLDMMSVGLPPVHQSFYSSYSARAEG